MVESPPRPRRVFVLGRGATLDVERVARQVIADEAELVLLSMGEPQGGTQAAAVADALRLADQLRLWLDVVLVTSPDQVASLVADNDDVTVLASGSERGRIERALARRVRSRPPHGLTRAGQFLAPIVATARPPTPTAFSEPAEPRNDGGKVATEAKADSEHDQIPTDNRLADMGALSSESVEALIGHEVAQPVLDTVWTRENAQAKKHATFRVYLGAAPGVGKTFAMLSEGQRRTSRGTDVVVGFVETYGRPRTIEMLEGLEVVPPRKMSYRGSTFEEMDADAVIERAPDVALIDELAHTNIPGSRRAKRWEDVIDILAEGIAVITTVNVQHLASLNDVVANITAIRQQETVPDWVLDLADQIELVDMSPHALQRRMLHGNVYPDPRKAELALQRFFTMENLTALRELALMRVANKVDEELLTRWSKGAVPETRERILVCVSRPGISEDLIRRGCRVAARAQGELLVVHVVTDEGPPDRAWIAQIERLVRDLGGEFHVLDAEDPVEAVLSFAYEQHVTQIIAGESLRSRWQELVSGSFVNRLIRRATNIDVHVIARRDR